jgi:hypothetical protein
MKSETVDKLFQKSSDEVSNEVDTRAVAMILANGYFAGENVSNEVKEAFVSGLLYGIRNHDSLHFA